MSNAPHHPFRVNLPGDFTGPPLSPPQRRVLAGLDAACPRDGAEATAHRISEVSGVRLGSVVVILRSLVSRGLAVHHREQPESWTPTMSGRLRGREANAAE